MGIFFLLIALIMALVLHEFAHAYVSNALGDPTARVQGRLTLDPRAHIDPMMTLLLPLFLILIHSPVIFGAARPVPFDPWRVRWGKWGAALVALAGPATNLLLAIFFALWLRLVPVGESAKTLFASIILVNLGFMVFNLIPFPPLDGSRLLYAVAPPPLRHVMLKIEQAGLIAIAAFILLGFPLIAPVIRQIVQALSAWLVPGFTQL